MLIGSGQKAPQETATPTLKMGMSERCQKLLLVYLAQGSRKQPVPPTAEWMDMKAHSLAAKVAHVSDGSQERRELTVMSSTMDRSTSRS